MFWRAVRSLARNDRGAVIVYVALGLVVFFPMMAIAIDLTNYLKLNTELKQAADAAALAAAVELDFSAQGLIDADNAAHTAVQNFQTGANDSGGSGVQIATVQFLQALPPAGNSNYNDYVTTDPLKARYVRVITETRQRDSVAFRAFAALFNSLKPAQSIVDANGAVKTTAADAVAGRVTVACKALPLMMCNPAEVTQTCGNPNVTGGSSYSLFSDFLAAHPEWRRHQFRIKWIGNNSSIAPGVFGLLKPLVGDFGNGAGAIRDELGAVDPTTCFEIQGSDVEIKTGQAQTVVDGLNVRFDIFRGPMGSSRTDPGYAPALNRTKGRPPSSNGLNARCDPSETTSLPLQAIKLPQDSCFANPASNNCDNLGPSNNQGNFNGRFGDGKWDVVTYFNINHPRFDGTANGAWGSHLGELQDLLQFIHANYGGDYNGSSYGPDPNPVTTTDPPSRWAVYRWEMAGAKFNGTLVGEQRIPEPLQKLTTWALPATTSAVPDRIPGANTRYPATGITTEEGRANAGSGNAFAQCSTQAPLGPTRRTLYIAVVNCCEQADALSSGDRRINVTEFAKAFMTQPACHEASGCANSGTGNNTDLGAIYVEVYDAVKATSADQVVLRDYVQLY